MDLPQWPVIFEGRSAISLTGAIRIERRDIRFVLRVRSIPPNTEVAAKPAVQYMRRKEPTV